MKKTRIVVALACALLPFGIAQAGQADICYSDPQPAVSATPPSNTTVFHCPTAGDRTLPQLAAEGWSIGQLTPIMVSSTQSAAQLVIQK